MKRENPYEKCPVYETGGFVFRLVSENDAKDLLACYSDPVSAKFFNSDNCTSDFVYRSLDEMKDCISSWLDEYAHGGFVRFAAIDKKTEKTVGTIEFFAKPETFEGYGKVGVLRLDLASAYEKEDLISEILEMIEGSFYDLFGVDAIVTKAVPEAVGRLASMKRIGYEKLEGNTIVKFGDYHVKKR